MSLHNVFSRIVTSLPYLIFILVAIFSAIGRGNRGRRKTGGKPAASNKNIYQGSSVHTRTTTQDPRIKRKAEHKKERRGMATDSDLVAQAYYVDANELDWSFEADNKPRKTPMGFDR